ncbi:MAG: HAD family hydrolase [Bacilli bacterium]
MIKTILFDLDGTLLPLDEALFIQKYFGLLGKKFVSLGLNSQTMLAAVWDGTKAMIENDGKVTNEECFWTTFESRTGLKRTDIEHEFLQFYEQDFDQVSEVSKKMDIAKEIVEALHAKGIKLILATNPIFPKIATLKRIKWAGLNPKLFSFITTYENSFFAKPNICYYEQIITQFQLQPEECLMVGNDVSEDMVVTKLGMPTFLLTDCLNNREGIDINLFHNGDFLQLYDYLVKQSII